MGTKDPPPPEPAEPPPARRPLRLPGDRRVWGKYAAEVAIVALGVALGLWATEWAADRRADAEVRDAYAALADELADNYGSIRYRRSFEPCVRRRIGELQGWIRLHRTGSAPALPDEIGRPGAYSILDSVWDVSKSGQIAAKMPLEVRRRYAAVYDILESYADHQRRERDVWSEIGDYAGRADLTPAELARLNGLVRRAEAIDYAIAANYRTLVKDLDLLKIRPPADMEDPPSKRVFCAPFRGVNTAKR